MALIFLTFTNQPLMFLAAATKTRCLWSRKKSIKVLLDMLLIDQMSHMGSKKLKQLLRALKGVSHLSLHSLEWQNFSYKQKLVSANVSSQNCHHFLKKDSYFLKLIWSDNLALLTA